MDFDDISPFLWVVIIGVPLLGAIGAFLFVRHRKARVESPYYFRCPSCKHKLKYFARQVGHKGMCGNCKERFVFPAPFVASRRVAPSP